MKLSDNGLEFIKRQEGFSEIEIGRASCRERV